MALIEKKKKKHKYRILFCQLWKTCTVNKTKNEFIRFFAGDWRMYPSFDYTKIVLSNKGYEPPVVFFTHL